MRKCINLKNRYKVNQEDSIIMNNSAIEKGLFRAQVLKKYQEEIKKNPASSQTGIFMKPDRNKVDNLRGKEDANYDKLGIDGYAKAETYIKDGDVIIGMVNPKASAKEDEKLYTDSSTIYKSVIPGAIDRVFTGFSGDGYPIIKMRVRSERIPIIGDKFACYDDQTEVLTDSGWTKFKKLTKMHKVATLVDGEKLVYEHPTEIQSYDYEGPMYLVESNQVNLCVTPNHRMWVAPRSAQGESVKNYRFERADEILGMPRIYQKSVNTYDGNFTEELNDPCFIPLILDDKSLPEWVWNLNMEKARIFIVKMIHDCIRENDTLQYDTPSKKLANDLQILCLHAGWSANITLKTESKTDIWGLTIIMKQNNPTVNENVDKQDQIINYKGKVYCCTVPSHIIYIRRNKTPIFSGNSLHGQKGTIGYNPHRADMPYTEDGLVPDLIINPNCMRRMTIGQLIECLFGKLCAIKGVYGDGTPFMGVDINRINEELVSHGMEEWGNQTMYCGYTGHKMTTKIFIGPTYYQRLKQMVGDKVHSRSNIGPKQLLTRQPSEGRVRNGGLRLGEMERDVLCAHGISQFLKERSVDNSDIYTTHICDICGLEAHKIPKKKHYICKGCQNTTRISRIVCPYAFMLFMKELKSMNVLGRIRTSKSIDIPRG